MLAKCDSTGRVTIRRAATARLGPGRAELAGERGRGRGQNIVDDRSLGAARASVQIPRSAETKGIVSDAEECECGRQNAKKGAARRRAPRIGQSNRRAIDEGAASPGRGPERGDPKVVVSEVGNRQLPEMWGDRGDTPC